MNKNVTATNKNNPETINGFLKELNAFGKKVCEFLYVPSPGIPLKFEFLLKENILISNGIIPSNEYYLIVDKIGMQWFGVNATFNNTGTTFWFYIKE